MDDVSVEWRKRGQAMENVSAEEGEYGMEDMRAGYRKCVGGRWGIGIENGEWRIEETRQSIETVSAEDGKYRIEETRAGHRKCVGERWRIRMEETRAGHGKCVAGRWGIWNGGYACGT